MRRHSWWLIGALLASTSAQSMVLLNDTIDSIGYLLQENCAQVVANGKLPPRKDLQPSRTEIVGPPYQQESVTWCLTLTHHGATHILELDHVDQSCRIAIASQPISIEVSPACRDPKEEDA